MSTDNSDFTIKQSETEMAELSSAVGTVRARDDSRNGVVN